MSGIRHFTPELQHPIPPLSYAVRAGDLVFVSGLPGLNPDGSLAVGNFAVQFARSVATMETVLALVGANRRDIVKANVLLTRSTDVVEMNRLYAGWFGSAPYPARTTVVVHALPHPDMLIEMECVVSLAYSGSSPTA